VKFENTSETKKKEYLKDEIEELESNSKIKNIRDLYRGISDFTKGYQLITNIMKMRRMVGLQASTVYWQGGRPISLSY